MRGKIKHFLAIVLCLVMTLTMLPNSVMAETETDPVSEETSKDSGGEEETAAVKTSETTGDEENEKSVTQESVTETQTIAVQEEGSAGDNQEIATLAERTEYPDVGIPDIDDLEWGMNLSKSATELDENYESTVTLSFQHDIDLVIVQDGTNLENETFSFLESLEEQEDMHVNCGLVVFGGTTPISWSSGELLDLSDPSNIELLDWALNEGAWDDTAGHSGSNVMAGIREARNMLNSDKTHDASDKFIVLMSDCAARMWIEGDDVDTAYAQARYITSTKRMYFDSVEDWVERYGLRISQSHNRLGESSNYLFDYPSFQDVWNAGMGGADLDNYVMSYPEWLEKEAAGDLDGSIAVTTGAEPNAVTMEEYYTNYETATWHTAQEIVEAAGEAHIDLISFAYYGYPLVQYTYGQYMDEFQEWIAELNNTKRYAYLESDPEGSGLLTASRIFEHISSQIEETEIGNGVLIDEIGDSSYIDANGNEVAYDFDFIDEIDRLHLTAAGETYDCTEIEPEKGETSAYGFGDANGSDDGTTYPFILRYYEEGYTYTDEYSGETETYGECFVLEINTGISKFYNFDEESGMTTKGISLTYDIVLTNPKTESGTYGTYDEYGENNDGSEDYGLYTNNQAYLYPRDKEGEPLPRQKFPKPTVSYGTAQTLTLGKTAEGVTDDENYLFKIALSTVEQDANGQDIITPYDGDLNVRYFTEDDSEANADTGILTFEDGQSEVTLPSGGYVQFILTSDSDTGINWSWNIEEQTILENGSVTILVNGEQENYVEYINGKATKAVAASGTIAEDSAEVMFINSYREYFDIDEEIVVDEEDRDSWVKGESVNEYNTIELEMSTYLPVITTSDMESGNFTMNFHNVLDSALDLDEIDTDFTVMIAGKQIDHQYYSIVTDSLADGCSFHVDINLSALYTDELISEDDLQGDTEIMIFFYADLEGTNLNGSYKSTVWYEIFDDDTLLYTSSEDVVEVYTYEIEILKYDASTLQDENYEGSALANATFGVYEDADCTEPVYRNVGQMYTDTENRNQPYTVTSGSDGYAIFYGLAEGTYYIREIEAPEGFIADETVIPVTISSETTDENHAYRLTFANTPEDTPEETTEISGTKTWDDNDDEYGKRPGDITIRLYADGEPSVDENGNERIAVVTPDEDDNWTYSFDNLPVYNDDGAEIDYTIAEDKLEDYITTIDGYDVTNTYAISLNVEKVWDDEDDKDGIRPESITIRLLKNGEAAVDENGDEITMTLSESNGWTDSFDDLVKYQDGEEIVYTVAEDPVVKYQPTISDTIDEDGNLVVNIVNKHTPTPKPSSTPNDNNKQNGSSGGSTIRPGSSGNGSSGGSTTTSAVKTGDNTPISMYLGLLVVALAIVGGIGIYRRRRNVAEK